MTIKMPMDSDLYDAAVEVLEAIEEKLRRARRVNELVTDEDVLGRPLALAYQRWRTLLIARYTAGEPEVPSASAEPYTRADRPPTVWPEPEPEVAEPPPSAVEKKKLHPWRNPPRNPHGKI